MIAFYKIKDENNYIIGFGINAETGVEEITQAEYDEIVSFWQTKPIPPEGYDYAMQDDNGLLWTLVEVQTPPDEPTDEDKAEAFDIIMGVNE